jgi:4-azaleucine resistance transporter AzlC
MKTLRYAFKQILPVFFTYVFVGIAFGILINEAGYSMPWALAASFFIYAGSMQIVMVPLLISGAPLYLFAVMTFFINARHIFYGLGFIEKFRKMGWKYPYMVLTLTDEVYSVLCSAEYPEGIEEEKANFLIALSCHILWVLSSGAGAFLGQALPFDASGIGFSAAAFFTTVCVNHWRQMGLRMPSLVGIVCVLGFSALLGADRFLLPALTTSVILLLFLRPMTSLQTGGIKNADNCD